LGANERSGDGTRGVNARCMLPAGPSVNDQSPFGAGHRATVQDAMEASCTPRERASGPALAPPSSEG